MAISCGQDIRECRKVFRWSRVYRERFFCSYIGNNQGWWAQANAKTSVKHCFAAWHTIVKTYLSISGHGSPLVSITSSFSLLVWVNVQQWYLCHTDLEQHTLTVQPLVLCRPFLLKQASFVFSHAQPTPTSLNYAYNIHHCSLTTIEGFQKC